MMTPEEHYAEADRLCADATRVVEAIPGMERESGRSLDPKEAKAVSVMVEQLLAFGQLHATLAQTPPGTYARAVSGFN